MGDNYSKELLIKRFNIVKKFTMEHSMTFLLFQYRQ